GSRARRRRPPLRPFALLTSFPLLLPPLPGPGRARSDLFGRWVGRFPEPTVPANVFGAAAGVSCEVVPPTAKGESNFLRVRGFCDKARVRGGPRSAKCPK